MVTRLTVDVSDGNASEGVTYGNLYELWAGIPAGTVITEIHADLLWDIALELYDPDVDGWTLIAAYPYNGVLQMGAAGFTPVAPTRGNYGNADIFQLDHAPMQGYSGVGLAGTEKLVLGRWVGFALDWRGEYVVAASSDLYWQSYAAHQASPQLQFQQRGTFNIFHT